MIAHQPSTDSQRQQIALKPLPRPPTARKESSLFGKTTELSGVIISIQ
jgi:hypothetical protein